MTLCGAFPASILGVMLAFSGMELALVCRDQTSRTDAFAMLLTAAACIGLNNIALGFLLGLAMTWCLRLRAFRVEEPAEKP
jgi:ABC-type microcin C transport system permease subunit YejE